MNRAWSILIEMVSTKRHECAPGVCGRVFGTPMIVAPCPARITRGLHEFIETRGRRLAPPRPTESTGGGGGRWASMTPAMRMGIRVATTRCRCTSWAAGVAGGAAAATEGKRCTHASRHPCRVPAMAVDPVPDAGDAWPRCRCWCARGAWPPRSTRCSTASAQNRLVVVEIKNESRGASRRGSEGRPRRRRAVCAAILARARHALNRARVQAMLCLAMLKRDARYTDLVARFAGRLSVFAAALHGRVGDALRRRRRGCIDLVNHYTACSGPPVRIVSATPSRRRHRCRRLPPHPASPTSDSSPDASNRHDEPTGPDVAICPITQRALDAVAVPCQWWQPVFAAGPGDGAALQTWPVRCAAPT